MENKERIEPRCIRQPNDYFDSAWKTSQDQNDPSLWEQLDRHLPAEYTIPDPKMTEALFMVGIEHTEAVRNTRGKSVKSLFNAKGSLPEELIDQEFWEVVCQELPGDYTIPDAALAEVLGQYHQITPPKICFLILAHENELVLAEQVANIRKFNPHAKIVLYNGGSDPQFGKKVGVDICPYSKQIKYGNLGEVLLDTMVWLEKTKTDYDFFLYLDSDVMFVNSGFECWLKTAMLGYDMMGINMHRYTTPQACQHWIPGRMMWEEWERWQPILQTNYIVGTLNGMQVYRHEIVQDLLDSTDLRKLRTALTQTGVFAPEEIVFATLAASCGGKHRPYPAETVQYVRLGTPYGMDDVRAARNKSYVYFMHPIERTLENPARQQLREYTSDEGQGSMKLEDKMRMLNSKAFMQKIIEALDKKQPLSIINVGATESYVLAQYTLLTEEEFMAHPEAKVANRGVKSGFHHRGIRFPNRAARDEAVEAVRKADLVGYNTLVRTMEGGLMTEKVFEAYGIKPIYLFEGYLRRVVMFTQKTLFENMLKGRKILLIGSLAPETREAMNRKLKDRLGFEIVGAIPIYEYEELPEVRRQIADYEFDLCLLSAGINALILAPYIAETYGKVAFDIGFGMQSLITGQVFEDQWMTDLIGMERLMRM